MIPESLDTFTTSYQTLITPLIRSLQESPCIPAHGIAKNLINNISSFQNYKAIIANSSEEIYTALCNIKQEDDLFVFSPVESHIASLIASGHHSLAQDYFQAWICRSLAHCSSQEILQGKSIEQYNPYDQSYRFSVGKEQYFPLLLTPSSDRPGRNYIGIHNSTYYICLTFQNYKTFDTFKIKNEDTFIDKLTMKNLRNKIREHLKNNKITCPFHKKNISEYPYEMEHIPLEASESNIPNKNYYLKETAESLGNILFARPTYLQLPGSPDLLNIQANDIKQVSIHDLLKLVKKKSY